VLLTLMLPACRLTLVVPVGTAAVGNADRAVDIEVTGDGQLKARGATGGSYGGDSAGPIHDPNRQVLSVREL
jgi:hypothetical protein